MLLNQVFLISLILGSPIYVLLQATLMVVPLYAVLLAIALVAALLLLKQSHHLASDEIIAFLVLLVSLTCALGGLVLAPLPVQLAIALGCLAWSQRQFAGMRS